MSDMGVFHFARSLSPEACGTLLKSSSLLWIESLDVREDQGLSTAAFILGNLLYNNNKQELHLIDYDEARYNQLTVCKHQTENQRHVYNEYLAVDFVPFTKNQLMHLFWGMLANCVDSWRVV